MAPFFSVFSTDNPLKKYDMMAKETAVFLFFYGIMKHTDVYAGEPVTGKHWRKLSVHNYEE